MILISEFKSAAHHRFAHEIEDADDIGDHVEKLFFSGVDKAAAAEAAAQ